MSLSLKELRKRKGLTQEQLAAKLKISVRTVIRCEQANKLPRSGLVAEKWGRVMR